MVNRLETTLSLTLAAVACAEIAGAYFGGVSLLVVLGWFHAASCGLMWMARVSGNSAEGDRNWLQVVYQVALPWMLALVASVGAILLRSVDERVSRPAESLVAWESLIVWAYGGVACVCYVMRRACYISSRPTGTRRTWQGEVQLLAFFTEQLAVSIVVMIVMLMGVQYQRLFQFVLLIYGEALLAECLVGEALAFVGIVEGRPLRGDVSQLRMLLWFERSQRSMSTSSTRWIRVALLSSGTLAAVGWLTTGCVLVRSHQAALRYRWGRVADQPLAPGFHFIWPLPFESVVHLPVKRLAQFSLGYRQDSLPVASTRYMWTKTHGREEYPWVVGDGTEALAINAIVQYKIGESTESMTHFVHASSDPVGQLQVLAQQILTETTRARSLETMLAAPADFWREKVLNRLRSESVRRKLGLEVVDFQLLSIHPPIETAGAFLDVVNARSQAEQQLVEFQGTADAERYRCAMMAETAIAEAKARAAARIAAACEESASCNAVADAVGSYGPVVEREYFDAMIGDALEGKTFVLIDHRLPPEIQIWFENAQANNP